MFFFTKKLTLIHECGLLWYIYIYGCPLSPYLFIIVMSVMFADINKDDNLKLVQHRPPGATFDEVLYADDTICVSENEHALNWLLEQLEIEGAGYGLKLNKTKCELLLARTAKNDLPIKFCDNSILKSQK